MEQTDIHVNFPLMHSFATLHEKTDEFWTYYFICFSVALDTAARSEQSSRQHTLETDRLRKELDKMERCRDNAIKENRFLKHLFKIWMDQQFMYMNFET